MRFALLCMLPTLAMMFPAFAATGQSKAPAGNKAPATTTFAPGDPGDPGAGKGKADDWRCIECHGRYGNGGGNDPEAKIAKLAGQDPAYLIKQFRDFRAGTRKNDYMEMIAKNVEDADLVDIAAFFANQNGPLGEARAGATDTNPVARDLFNHGDKARNIAACASCHGAIAPQGKPVLPRIHGQAHGYLEKQLYDWRSGERHNDPERFMNLEAKSLTDTEIQALAQYLSTVDASAEGANK
ncbi:MAG TPA: c-type cytochrome [Burkholderiaceae bacterium]